MPLPWDHKKASSFLQVVRDQMAAGRGMSDRTFERMALLSNPDAARTKGTFVRTLRRVGWSEGRIERAVATVRPRTKVVLHVVRSSSKVVLTDIVDVLAELGEAVAEVGKAVLDIRRDIPPIAIGLLVILTGIAVCVHPESDTLTAFLLSCGMGAGYIFGRAVDRPSKR